MQTKTTTMGLAFKAVVVVLQLYFLLMNATVEMRYCSTPLSPTQPGLLAKETYEFSTAYNRLFLARPEWMRQATCVSAYCFWLGYVASRAEGEGAGAGFARPNVDERERRKAEKSLTGTTTCVVPFSLPTLSLSLVKTARRICGDYRLLAA